MPNKFKIGVRQKMRDIFLIPGDKIIQTNDMIGLHELFTKMGAKKTRSASDKNIFLGWLRGSVCA